MLLVPVVVVFVPEVRRVPVGDRRDPGAVRRGREADQRALAEARRVRVGDHRGRVGGLRDPEVVRRVRVGDRRDPVVGPRVPAGVHRGRVAGVLRAAVVRVALSGMLPGRKRMRRIPRSRRSSLRAR